MVISRIADRPYVHDVTVTQLDRELIWRQDLEPVRSRIIVKHAGVMGMANEENTSFEINETHDRHHHGPCAHDVLELPRAVDGAVCAGEAGIHLDMRKTG